MRGLMIFDGQGSYGRTIALRPDPGAVVPIPPQIVGLLPDGTWLALARPITDPRRTGSWTDSLSVLRVSRSGDSTTTLGAYPSWEQFNSGPPLGPMMLAFGPRGMVMPGGPGYCFGNGEQYEIRCYATSGALVRIVRRESVPQPVTEELAARYRENLASFPVEPGMDPERMKEHRRRVADATRFAERLPFFRRFQLDGTGHLWVRNYRSEDDMPRITDVRSFPLPTEPASWSAFDPNGVWLGDVELPAGFSPIEFGADYVLGFGRDADENDQVWQLRLERR